MTGLVVEGGGMRGIYACGVLDGFLERGISFDYCVAVSAGAANAASFLAGQRGRNYRFFTRYSRDVHYMGVGNYFRTGSFFGVDYIYGELTNRVDPIDYDRLLSCESIFKVVAADAQTGRAVYFGLEDFAVNDCRALMASSAIPVFCKPVELGDMLLFDGGTVDPIPVGRALEDGCDTVVTILSRPLETVRRAERLPALYHRLLSDYPHIAAALDEKHSSSMKSIELIRSVEREGRAIVVAPKSDAGVGVATRNRKRLDDLYEMGLADGLETALDGFIKEGIA